MASQTDIVYYIPAQDKMVPLPIGDKISATVLEVSPASGNAIAVTPTGLYVNALGGGGGELYYEHQQPSASTTWIINHNLGIRPEVGLFTVGGVKMVGEVIHLSANTAQASFDSPVAGFAICT